MIWFWLTIATPFVVGGIGMLIYWLVALIDFMGMPWEDYWNE